MRETDHNSFTVASKCILQQFCEYWVSVWNWTTNM